MILRNSGMDQARVRRWSRGVRRGAIMSQDRFQKESEKGMESQERVQRESGQGPEIVGKGSRESQERVP